MLEKKSLKTFLIVVFIAIALFMVIFYLLLRPNLKNLYAEADVNFKTERERFRELNPLNEEFDSKFYKIKFNYFTNLGLEENRKKRTINLYRKSQTAVPKDSSLIYIEIKNKALASKTDFYKLRHLEPVLLANAPAFVARYSSPKEKEGMPRFVNQGHQVYVAENPFLNNFWYVFHINPEMIEEALNMIFESVKFKS